MDPNETLRKLREWANRPESSSVEESKAMMAFQDLDEWLSLGGSYPSAWRSRAMINGIGIAGSSNTFKGPVA